MYIEKNQLIEDAAQEVQAAVCKLLFKNITPRLK
jgi:hypothetical protein